MELIGVDFQLVDWKKTNWNSLDDYIEFEEVNTTVWWIWLE